MRNIPGSPQAHKRLRNNPDLIELPDKQQHLRSTINVPQTRRGRSRCRALGLPVKEPLADRVIVVHRGWREVLLGFIERDEEDVQILLSEIQDSLAFAGHVDPFRSPVAEPRKNLVAGIRAVQGDGGGETDVERAFEHFGFFQNDGKQYAILIAKLINDRCSQYGSAKTQHVPDPGKKYRARSKITEAALRRRYSRISDSF